MSNLKIEMMIRDAQIDRKAAELVRSGVAPYTAIRQAAKAVDEENARKNVESFFITAKDGAE